MGFISILYSKYKYLYSNIVKTALPQTRKDLYDETFKPQKGKELYEETFKPQRGRNYTMKPLNPKGEGIIQ